MWRTYNEFNNNNNMFRVNCECKKTVKMLLKCNYKCLTNSLDLTVAYLYCLILLFNCIVSHKFTVLIYKEKKWVRHSKTKC